LYRSRERGERKRFSLRRGGRFSGGLMQILTDFDKFVRNFDIFAQFFTLVFGVIIV
jgi:hypothetical protein